MIETPVTVPEETLVILTLNPVPEPPVVSRLFATEYPEVPPLVTDIAAGTPSTSVVVITLLFKFEYVDPVSPLNSNSSPSGKTLL